MAVTFRDFAAAIMSGNVGAAAANLEPLLGLTGEAARAAAAHFHAQFVALGPPFMGKAMGLRTAVTGPEPALAALLTECFALTGAPLATAIATLTAVTA